MDYKIASKSIANRIKHTLPSIISPQQTGFIKGRYIGENVRLLFDILDHINENDLSSILFFSDFEKAFDSLNHDFMIRCLKHFNFGDSLISWINLFYSKSISCTINNGHLSDFFPIERGVRQGCPLSPYLFIICIELLSYEISNNTLIKGICFKGQEIKNTLFADDATFITDGTERSFTTLVDVLDNFSYISGLNLNSTKCSALRAGHLKHSNITFCKGKKFTWCSDSSKALGMVFCNNSNNNNIFVRNLQPKIDAFCNCLKQWQHRKLSLIGRITVIKSFAFPKLIYPLTVLANPPANYVKQIKNTMFDFLWNKKPDKIKRNIIINNYEYGGLKMLDIEKFMNSLKSSWIKRLLNDKNNGKWKIFYNDKLTKFGGKLIFESNLNEKDVKTLIPKTGFLQDIILAWSKINFDSSEKKNIGKELLWNNSFIKNGGRPFFNQVWYERGIQFIEHIYDFRKKEFFKFSEIVDLYDLSHKYFLFYNSLVASILTEWKVKLKTEMMNIQRPKTLLMTSLEKKHINKYLYQHQFQKDVKIKVKQEDKWINIFNDPNLDWKHIYLTPIRATIDTTLRDFQYKFIMQIIPTNTFLLKCKISNSNLCDFCNNSIETVVHLFWECQHSQHFWSQLKTFLTEFNIDIDFNYKIICFGKQNDQNKNVLVNFIIISAKYFIFKNKYAKTIPNFQCFKNFLFKRIEIEKVIAMEKDKLEQHRVKWQAIT